MKKYIKIINGELVELGDFLEGEAAVKKNGVDIVVPVKIYGASDKDKRDAGYIPYDEYINKEINRYKTLLAESDYKVIKCYEASVKNVELPYDLDAVIELRDGYRAEINSFEEELREYLATV